MAPARVLPALLAAAVVTTHAAVPIVNGLQPSTFKPLPTGSVTPKGWLLQQLKLQAQGLSGHLSQFWDDVMDSVWIGGSADGGLHERTPYWLNGIVPLAFLLENAGVRELPGTRGVWKTKDDLCQDGVDSKYADITNFFGADAPSCYSNCSAHEDCFAFVFDSCNGQCWLKKAEETLLFNQSCRCYGVVNRDIPPVNLMKQATDYVDHILGFQNATGWFGPPINSGTDFWGRSNVVLALEQFAEGKGRGSAEWTNITTALVDYLMQQKALLERWPMTSWASERWQDMALGAQWVIDNAPQGHEADIAELAATMYAQGVDWETWFETFEGNAGPHNVNNAQGIKSSGVLFRQTGNETLRDLSLSRMANLDRLYGLPTGMFNGDELLPQPATRNPSRGIETCGVVEAMFSYNTLFSVFGDVSFADRAERIAYNALPATWASPKGGDMWAHQYLQAVNEITALVQPDHVWTHDGPDAEMYGLEPNYGCCTANFNQGWPKFAHMLVFETDDGAAIGAYAPATVKLSASASTVDVDTDYPFGDTVTVTVDAEKDMALYLRVPGWASRATIDGKATQNGTMAKVQCKAGKNRFTLNLNPDVRLENWDNGAVSVHRGALMYSLPLAGHYEQRAHYFGPDHDWSSDWEVNTTSTWNYALDVDSSDPSKSLRFDQTGPYVPGSSPWNHTGWPVSIQATARQVKAWGIAHGSAATPPASPACASADTCGAPVPVTLVPHGGTDLRMGEFPTSGK